jgi:hypothetical protein
VIDDMADSPRPEPGESGAGAPLRLAVIGTPRSGNTWLRHLLAATYRLEERAVHTPGALDWRRLPQRLVLQLHWLRTGHLAALLADQGFQIVVPARHPLDVLISILHFAAHEPETAQWLAGLGGSEAVLHHGATPIGREFLEYAVGRRAAVLLSVSSRWWNVPGSHRSRYEDLVRDTVVALQTLTSALGRPVTAEVLAGAVEANGLDRLRATSTNSHFWQGRPGLWRELLPPAEARLIARTHRSMFETLGYACDPDEALDHDRAEAHWSRLRQAPAGRVATPPVNRLNGRAVCVPNPRSVRSTVAGSKMPDGATVIRGKHREDSS